MLFRVCRNEHEGSRHRVRRSNHKLGNQNGVLRVGRLRCGGRRRVFVGRIRAKESASRLHATAMQKRVVVKGGIGSGACVALALSNGQPSVARAVLVHRRVLRRKNRMIERWQKSSPNKPKNQNKRKTFVKSQRIICHNWSCAIIQSNDKQTVIRARKLCIPGKKKKQTIRINMLSFLFLVVYSLQTLR
jgi:hypothetical protein